ncbi:MAG: metal-dependent hydrolase [Acutalibacteraceae bacterium]|nr:metal-dependent hydrolase [Acutalibacteraceae bacterium]
MLGKTHMMVGMATALALTAPDSAGGLIAAIVGGAVGSSISDVDVSVSKRGKDALYTRLIATGLVPIALLIDFIFKGGIVRYMIECPTAYKIIGVLLFVALCVIGKTHGHRGFTHSLLGFVLFCVSVSLFCKPVLVPFAIGFATHLILDVFNKKPIKLFWPVKKGLCFNLCCADKMVDKLLLLVGSVATVVFLVISLLAM